MSDAQLKELFARPENDRTIRDTWDTFMRGGGHPSDTLRFLVGDSWRRCVDSQVDPGRDQAPVPLVDQAIAELRLRHRELLEASKPVMQHARDFLSETDTVMVLTDPNGTLLDVEGDTNTLTSAEKIHLLSGASWNEGACGTNAIGTALSLGQPVQIHSAEHFCEGMKRWTCSASVIRHPSIGEVLGVIDISGLTRSYSPQNLSLVVTAANRIESHLAKKEMALRYRLLDHAIGALATNDGSGVVVVDRHGVPIKLNEYASAACARWGISFDFTTPTRIQGLAGAGATTVVSESGLPKWLRTDWIEPVFENGERIGSIVRIPSRSPISRSRPVSSVAIEAVALENFPGATGRNSEFRQAIGKATQLAKSRVPILLLGETGAGKEVFARGIHHAGLASDGPFVALNCGGLSRDLLASELFGYSDGAFTGARRGGMVGKIEAADGGTLFLDELGEMPIDLQPHFLRVLEDGQIIRLGETAPRKVSFRLVAATNRDLRKEVAEGRFRMDLFYRIAVTSIRIPALRERKDDIPILARHFLKELCATHGISEKQISPDALSLMERFAWPGNVRELRNVIESLVLTVSESTIHAEDLPHEIFGSEPLPGSGPSMCDSKLRGLARGEFEQICKVLEDTGGNATLAAKTLGIAKSTLYLKLKKYSLDESLDSWRSAANPGV